MGTGIQAPPVGYLLEDTTFQYHWSPTVSRGDLETVCSILGPSVEVDAARFGSRAHRLRNFWTNFCYPDRLMAAIRQAERPVNMSVEQILEPNREPAPVMCDDKAPWYVCNRRGHPRLALPTLVAFKGSYAFCPGQPGIIWDQTQQAWTEPTACERERALGYTSGDTAAEGVTELQRCQLLGRCMDANCMQALFAIAEAWHLYMQWAGLIMQKTS